MRILVVGSGGREHALAWKISRSPLCESLHCAPGNPGMASLATLAPLRADDVDGIVRYVRDGGFDLVVIGPEVPLVAGLADRLADDHVPVFGPTAAAAEIEGSKAFAKDVMVAAGIPTADYGVFDEPGAAIAWSRERAGRVVVKADGLAAGKGVVVAGSVQEAEQAIHAMLVDRVHGAAGARILVEERLEGREASCIAFTDGDRVRMLPAAQDHKRVGDGDTGPNTGGMGAYSPSPAVTPELAREVEEKVMLPALREMARRGRPFRGALYAGVMLTRAGIRVLEFNARLGDPETQPILMRLRSDLVPILLAAAHGDLSEAQVDVDPRAAVGVVLAAEGYPAAVRTGDVIDGADQDLGPDVQVFHAGTARRSDGALVAAGGRVLTVCALGAGIAAARDKAYSAMERITLRGGHYRRDIGVGA
jgi:phosphoribosylamine--glycine ligase